MAGTLGVLADYEVSVLITMAPGVRLRSGMIMDVHARVTKRDTAEPPGRTALSLLFNNSTDWKRTMTPSGTQVFTSPGRTIMNFKLSLAR